jgi:phosphoribosyl 1,2-cyclic phosphate phosphodiesterase
MKIKILGTAAYERVPAMFCQCAVCEQARKLRGKNIRTQAQALINDDLLVDFGQDNYIHYLNGNADYTKIRNIIVTHTHEDHFMPNELCMTTGGFAHNDISEPIGIWGNKHCAELFSANPFKTICTMNQIVAYDTFSAGKYTITALPASHGTDQPFVYIISDGEKTVLYNNDTGLWKDEVYAFVAKQQYRFDCVLSDCTFGFLDRTGVTHMSIGNNIVHRNRLLEIGAITQSTTWVVTHFSHDGLMLNGQPATAEELEQNVAKNGMIAAYDGIEILA